MAEPMAYFQGGIVPAAEAKVPIMTHALHYGTAIFEGIRGNWNKEQEITFIFRPREHFVRFLDGCKMLRMSLPVSEDDLVDITTQVVQAGGFREDLYIRPLAFKSAARVANLKLHELEDDFTVIATPFGRYIDTLVARCITSSWRRIDETMIPPRVKISGLYVNSILAKTDAVMAGYDEAILLNQDGHVSEGTGENIFLVKGNRLITPPLYSNILNGITRDTVIEVAQNELNITVEERPIGRGELYLADEIFLTGTAAHLTAVGELDNRSIGTGDVGPITQVLQTKYHDIISGRDPKYLHWCVPVTPTH